MNSKNEDSTLDDFNELNELFGQDNKETKKAENIILSQNLDGFASCFPDWDLYPPIND